MSLPCPPPRSAHAPSPQRGLHRQLALLVALASLALLAVATTVPAHGDATHLTVRGHDDGGSLRFTVEGHDGANPSIVLAPGTAVEITFVNDGPDLDHNLHVDDAIVGSGDVRTDLIPPGETTTLAFTVVDEAYGTASYWCDPHRGAGMRGAAISSEDIDPADGGTGVPGAATAVALVGLAVAGLVRRRG